MQDIVTQCKTRKKNATITFRVPSELSSRLREIARSSDRSLGYICVKALDQFVTNSTKETNE